jgi:hypothetical protein
MYKIYEADDEYVVTADDPTQTIRGDLSAMLRLWSRLDAFVRDQQHDGVLDRADLMITGVEMIEMTAAIAESIEIGHPIQQRTLRYNLDSGKVPGAVKVGGRWQIPRAQFHEWLRSRG